MSEQCRAKKESCAMRPLMNNIIREFTDPLDSIVKITYFFAFIVSLKYFTPIILFDKNHILCCMNLLFLLFFLFFLLELTKFQFYHLFQKSAFSRYQEYYINLQYSLLVRQNCIFLFNFKISGRIFMVYELSSE
jgi:hypothetical protein